MSNIISNIKKFLPAILIIIAGIILYNQTLHYPFQFDDRDFIVNNTNIRNVYDNKAIWNALAHPSRYIAFYTFAINYHFHELDVFGYHLVNIVIHIFNALCLYGFVLLLSQTPAIDKKSSVYTSRKSIALFAALLFIAHPLQTQAVTYITQRFASLATLFYLLTMFLYLKARLSLNAQTRIILFVCAGASALLGMFTKQITFTMPFAILLMEYFFFKNSKNSTTTDSITTSPRLKWYIIVGLLLSSLIIPSFFNYDLQNTLFMTTPSGSYENDIVTQKSYAITQLRVICTYMRLIVFPIGQNLDYDFPLSQSLLETKTLLCGLIIILFLLIAWFLRHKNKLLSFGIVWFFLTLSVESSIIPIHHIIFEHRVYLPSVGAFIAIACIFHKIIPKKLPFTIIALITIILLGILTIQRNHVWRTEISLWEDVIQKSPNKSKAFNNLGSLYFQNNELDKALQMINRAIEIRPDYASAYNNRGAVYLKQNLNNLALKNFDKALSLEQRSETFNNKGEAYKNLGQIDLAMQNFDKSIELDDNNNKAYNNRGIVWGEKAQYEKALQNFNKAISINKNYAEAFNNRGVVYLRQNKLSSAHADFDKAISLDKSNIDAVSNKGDLYQKTQEHQLALKYYNKALQINANAFKVYNSMGVTYGIMADFPNAIESFEKAIAINSSYTEAYSNLGLVYKKMNNPKQALSLFAKAIALNPNHPYAYFNRSLIYWERKQYQLAYDDVIIAQKLGYAIQQNYLLALQNNIKNDTLPK